MSTEVIQKLAELTAAKLTEKERAEAEVGGLVDQIKELRDVIASDIARENFGGIVVGSFIGKHGGDVFQVERIFTDSIYFAIDAENAVAKLTKPVTTVKAHCLKISRTTGKPQQRRGRSFRATKDDDGFDRETLSINGYLNVIPESEVRTKREKAAKTDAMKEFGKLSPEEQAAILAKFGGK